MLKTAYYSEHHCDDFNLEFVDLTSHLPALISCSSQFCRRTVDGTAITTKKLYTEKVETAGRGFQRQSQNLTLIMLSGPFVQQMLVNHSNFPHILLVLETWNKISLKDKFLKNHVKFALKSSGFLNFSLHFKLPGFRLYPASCVTFYRSPVCSNFKGFYWASNSPNTYHSWTSLIFRKWRKNDGMNERIHIF